MTTRQAEKEVQRVAYEFEAQLEMGLCPDNKQSFQTYALYFLETKKAGGTRSGTLIRYRNILERVFPAIGHIAVKDITPQMLNKLWRNLEEPGMCQRRDRFTAKEAFLKAARSQKGSELASAAGVSYDVVYKAKKGKVVSYNSADRLSRCLGMKLDKAFEQEKTDKRLEPATIRSYATAISSVFSLAVKEGLCLTNPVSRSTLPKVPQKEAPHLELETVEALLEALDQEPEHWRTLFHFLLITGCRRGEALALHWSKIDFNAGSVIIDRSFHLDQAPHYSEGPTKTGKSRKISLPQETLLMLKQHRILQLKQCLEMGDAWEGETDYVFTGPTGKPMAPDWVSGWMSQFAKRHGLPPLHTHELRHTAASLMISNGVDITEVARRLGHSRTSTTLNIYAHALESSDKAAANTLAAVVYAQKKEQH